MDRKQFLKTSCFACLGITFSSSVLQSCVSVKHTTGRMDEHGIWLDLTDFQQKNQVRSYVIVRQDALQYPICVYRIDETIYSALWMKCTHQGAELQVSGDQLTCAAHGSEFDKWGKVVQAPALENLRTFPTSIVNGQLFIDLRKQV